MNILKNTIQKAMIENKTFSYSKNKVNLSFTLRIDQKQELKDFKDLLQEAIKDIDKELCNLE